MKKLLMWMVVASICASCQQSSNNADKTTQDVVTLGTADKKSASLVSQSVDAMGGQAAYDAIDIISWTFFGARHLVWDKSQNLVRIDSPRDSSIYLLDMNTMEGVYAKDGVVEKDAAILKQKMEKAKSIWINDSYWLVMPWKLRDPGVSLNYLRQDTLKNKIVANGHSSKKLSKLSHLVYGHGTITSRSMESKSHLIDQTRAALVM